MRIKSHIKSSGPQDGNPSSLTYKETTTGINRLSRAKPVTVRQNKSITTGQIKVTETLLQGVTILEPRRFGDTRGFFLESWNRKQFLEATGINSEFVQDNHSRSGCGVLRGLHYQIKRSQGKLVRVLNGEVLDVAVDLRRSSPTFGCHTTVRLTAGKEEQLWIPAGFAHGFVVLSESADFLYKTTDYYAPEYERCIRWNDPILGINWQLNGKDPIVSDKDREGIPFDQAETFS
jgi:dTDP-4-dehydrorhamnose 3,5-epimerase